MSCNYLPPATLSTKLFDPFTALSLSDIMPFSAPFLSSPKEYNPYIVLDIVNITLYHVIPVTPGSSKLYLAQCLEPPPCYPLSVDYPSRLMSSRTWSLHRNIPVVPGSSCTKEIDFNNSYCSLKPIPGSPAVRLRMLAILTCRVFLMLWVFC